MVELTLNTEDWASFANDHYISVRVGDVQKLTKMAASRTYKFPQSAIANRKYGKVEVYRRVGTSVVCVDPERATGTTEVEIELDKATGTKIRFDAQLNEGASAGKAAVAEKKEGDAKPKSASQKNAAAYLAEHHLEVRLADAMQAVLRQRPADPAAFLADILKGNASVAPKMPKDTSAPASPQAKQQPTTTGPATAQPKKVVPFGQYYAEHFPKGALSADIFAKFKQNVPKVTFPSTPAAPATSAQALVAKKLPSVGTWLGAKPLCFKKAFEAEAKSVQPTPVAAVTPAKYHLRPSVGTWLAKPSSFSAAVGGQAPAASAKPQPQATSAAAPAPAPPAAPAPAAKTGPEFGSHMVSNVSVMGANFWGMGMSPSFSFM